MHSPGTQSPRIAHLAYLKALQFPTQSSRIGVFAVTTPFDAQVQARLVRYAQIDSQSDESSDSVPSTAGQFDVLRALERELLWSRRELSSCAARPPPAPNNAAHCGRIPVPTCTATPIGPIAQRLEQETHNLLVPGSNPGGPTNSRFLLTLPASQKAQPLRTAAGSCGSARGPVFPPSRARKPEKCSLPRLHSLSPWSPESQEPSDEVIHTIKINHLRLVQEYELEGRRGWQLGVKPWR